MLARIKRAVGQARRLVRFVLKHPLNAHDVGVTMSRALPRRDAPCAAAAAASGALLADRVVVVTGGSGLIGSTICETAAAEGARVVVHYHRRAAEAQEIVRRITAAGGDALAVAADLRVRSEVDLMAARVRERFGRVDVLVNNASAQPGEVPVRGFLDHTWLEFEAYLDTIVLGTFNCTQAILPLMLAQKRGAIINIGSTSLHKQNAQLNPYATAKGGLLGMTRSLAAEFGRDNVTVNQIVPGWMWREDRALYTTEREAFQSRCILGEGIARPVDVARVVVFLGSAYGEAITGAYLPVCAGEILPLNDD